ncbi:MAG TPA: nucleotidyltransferase domain-containing protein [Casimicrobiaceae bacterium]|nr:nucleotidyltransferase domain-containing protein [Casimicrobiaceae bacterium]
MYAAPPPEQRQRLLNEIVGDLAQDPEVVGIFVAGSLASGTADTHSDIDLRVVVTPSAISDVCANRLDRPRRWTGFLFNEWDEDINCCVCHFEHFAKVDIYYIAADHLKAWLRPSTPVRVAHDPSGLIAAAQLEARMPAFEPADPLAVEQAVGKTTGYAIEVARRLARGELVYAQTLLDALRDRLVVLEDLFERRLPGDDSATTLENRASPLLLVPLEQAGSPLDGAALQAALVELAGLCHATVSKMHARSLLRSPATAFLQVLEQLAVAGPT